jgi:hypothetical protein
VFGFAEQLSIGSEGEAALQKMWHGPKLTKHPKRAYDFDGGDGSKVEVKTDTYDMSKTTNFFIERWSVEQQQKPGSVWQSLEKGVTVFVYFFKKNNTYFVFDNLPLLQATLEVYIEKCKPPPMRILNKGYNALGFKVPRAMLAGLYVEYYLPEGETKAIPRVQKES